MKYLGLNKGEMSVKISLINSPKLKLDRPRARKPKPKRNSAFKLK